MLASLGTVGTAMLLFVLYLIRRGSGGEGVASAGIDDGEKRVTSQVIQVAAAYGTEAQRPLLKDG